METKTCCTCQEQKPVTSFWRNKNAVDGRNWRCIQCYRPNTNEKVGKSHLHNGEVDEALLALNTKITAAYAGHKKPLTNARHLAHEILVNSRRRGTSRTSEAKRGCDLSVSDVAELLIEFCRNNYYEIAPRHPFRPSLDRLDNSKGYDKGNVRIVWLIENYAKNTFSEEQLIEFCKRKLGLV